MRTSGNSCTRPRMEGGGGQCLVSYTGPRSPTKTCVVGGVALLRPGEVRQPACPPLVNWLFISKALGRLQPWDSGRKVRRGSLLSRIGGLSASPLPFPCHPGEQMAALKQQRCRRASWPSRQSFRKELAALTSGHWYPGARHSQDSRKSPLSLCTGSLCVSAFCSVPRQVSLTQLSQYLLKC